MFIVIVIVIVIVVRVVVISMRIDFIIVVLSLFCYWFVLKPTEKLSDALHPSKKKKRFSFDCFKIRRRRPNTLFYVWLARIFLVIYFTYHLCAAPQQKNSSFDEQPPDTKQRAQETRLPSRDPFPSCAHDPEGS